MTGSTRMKAGTAQKIVLNTLSTTIMIKIGKVYQNLMVDMLPTNAKLVARAEQIIMAVTGAPLTDVRRVMANSSNNIKLSIIMLKADCDRDTAQTLLAEAEGVVGRALQLINAAEGSDS